MALGNGEKNVAELLAATGFNQVNALKHLKTLTGADILSRRTLAEI